MLSWKQAVAIVGAVLAVVALAAVVAATRRSASDLAVGGGTGAPALTASEQAFYNSVTSTTDLETRPVQAVVKTGHDICANIGLPGVTRLGLLAQIQGAKWSAMNSVALLTAAEANLCPDRRYALPVVVPTVAPTTPPVAAMEPVTEGPAKVIGVDATYEVGVEIAAGKWKSSGGAGMCYWARLKANAERDIIDNEVGGEGDTVWVKAGELFKVQDCGTWSWVAEK